LLGTIATAIDGRIQATLRQHPNQNTSSAAALKLISAFEGCSNRSLSQALKLSHPATVRLIDRLETTGLVDRRPGADRREVALHLTPAGQERARTLIDARSSALESIVDLLSAEQRQQLDAIAETLLSAMVSTPIDAAHLCRLCDETNCPPADCPVHTRAHELPPRERGRGWALGAEQRLDTGLAEHAMRRASARGFDADTDNDRLAAVGDDTVSRHVGLAVRFGVDWFQLEDSDGIHRPLDLSAGGVLWEGKLGRRPRRLHEAEVGRDDVRDAPGVV